MMSDHMRTVYRRILHGGDDRLESVKRYLGASQSLGSSTHIRTQLTYLAKDFPVPVTAVWVAGHRNVEGNERADRLASAAAAQGTVTTDLTTQRLLPIGPQADELTWKHDRDYIQLSGKASSTAQDLTPLDEMNRGNDYKAMDASSTRRRVRWLTGLVFPRTAAEKEKICTCGASRAVTAELHLLFDCPLSAPHRQRLDIVRGPDQQHCTNNAWIRKASRLDEYLATLDNIVAGIETSVETFLSNLLLELHAGLPLEASPATTTS